MSITWKLEPITTSNAMCVQTGKSAYSVHTEEGYFHSAPAAICLRYFSMPWSTIMMMMVMKVMMMMMQAKMASVTRGYHEHRRGILLKVPINPTPGLPTDHSHTISISANLNSLLSHHLTKNL